MTDTNDIIVDLNSVNSDITLSSGKFTAIYFKGKTYQNSVKSYAVQGNDLVITTATYFEYKIILKEYFKQNGKNSYKYIKTDEKTESGHLVNIIESALVTNPNLIKPSSTTASAKGTVFNDTINASSYIVPSSGTDKGKGVTIEGNSGNDTIVGSNGADSILGGKNNDRIDAGKGNDTIEGGVGDDTIKGGTGKNSLIYSKGDGNDVIQLTKGEKFNLDLKNIAFSDILYVSYKNGDLVFGYLDNTDTTDVKMATITFRKFANSDVTNNKTDKKKDTSSVTLTFDGENEVDLKTSKTFYMYKVTKDFDGAWFNEYINAEDYSKTSSTSLKGLILQGASGHDTIDGSKYNDTIKGGSGDDIIRGGLGNDIITGGSGENTLNYVKGEGNDTINLTKGEKHTLNLRELSVEDLTFSFSNDNLVLSYTDDNLILNKITFKGFAKSNITNNKTDTKADTSYVKLMFNGDEESVIDLRNSTDIYNITAESDYKGRWLNENINAASYTMYDKDGDEITNTSKRGLNLSGAAGKDDIIGTRYSDSIVGGSGDDTIIGGSGNDTIKGGSGNNDLDGGLGNDKIYVGSGSDIVTYADGEGKDNLYNSTKKTTLNIEYDVDFSSSTKIYVPIFLKKNDNLTIITDNDSSSETLSYESAITIRDYFVASSKIDKLNIYDVNGKTQTDVSNSIKELLYQYGIYQQGKGVLKGLKGYSNHIIGSTNSDSIFGNNKDDYLFGNAGNDIIKGNSGDDTIIGGLGNDKLYGVKGDNLFIFNQGDGNDIVYSGTGSDTLKFNDIYQSALKAVQKNNDLIVAYDFNSQGKATSKVTIKNYYESTSFEYIETETGRVKIEDILNENEILNTPNNFDAIKSSSISWQNTSKDAIFALNEAQNTGEFNMPVFFNEYFNS